MDDEQLPNTQAKVTLVCRLRRHEGSLISLPADQRPEHNQ